MCLANYSRRSAIRMNACMYIYNMYTDENMRLQPNPSDHSNSHHYADHYMHLLIMAQQQSACNYPARCNSIGSREIPSPVHILTKPPRVLGLRTDQQLTAGLTTC